MQGQLLQPRAPYVHQSNSSGGRRETKIREPAANGSRLVMHWTPTMILPFGLPPAALAADGLGTSMWTVL